MTGCPHCPGASQCVLTILHSCSFNGHLSTASNYWKCATQVGTWLTPQSRNVVNRTRTASLSRTHKMLAKAGIRYGISCLLLSVLDSNPISSSLLPPLLPARPVSRIQQLQQLLQDTTSSSSSSDSDSSSTSSSSSSDHHRSKKRKKKKDKKKKDKKKRKRKRKHKSSKTSDCSDSD